LHFFWIFCIFSGFFRNFLHFLQLLNEEITPTVQKLKAERATYLEFQKTQRELDHLTKLYTAYQVPLRALASILKGYLPITTKWCRSTWRDNDSIGSNRCHLHDVVQHNFIVHVN
jgi:hypothetical protein